MDKISTFLWFDDNAEEAARFYISLFPSSRIDRVTKAPGDFPDGTKGSVLTVDFSLDGRSFIALNGGPQFKFTEAISLSIDCADQAEIDRYWDTLIADGGEPSMCGWLKDRFGLSWQVVPRQLIEMYSGPDQAAAQRAFGAMMKMKKLDLAGLERAYAGETATAGRSA